MFSNIEYFVRVIKKVYRELYEEEKATQQLIRLKIRGLFPEYLATFL